MTQYGGERYPEVGLPAWKLITRYEDLDNTTGFDTGWLTISPVKELVMVLFLVEENADANNDLYMRVNEDSSANYYYTERSGDTLTAHTDANEWNLKQTWSQPVCGQLILRGKKITGAANQWPDMSAQIGGHDGHRTLQNATLQVGYDALTSLRIWGSSAAMAGKVAVYGMDFP